MSEDRETILNQIRIERERQDTQWGPVDTLEHDAGKWTLIAVEELGEVSESFLTGHPVLARGELIQLAAVIVSWIEHLDSQA